MSKPLTFNNGLKFVEHVLPEPTEGTVPDLKKIMSRLKDQSTSLHAARDQAQATVSTDTQQVADMATAGKSAKAINEVLAEGAHALALIDTINAQREILGQAAKRIGAQLDAAKRHDADWQQYLATCQRWRRIYDDGLHAVQREHVANPISPAHVTGREPKKAAQLEADRKMAARWQETMEDLADEMLFRFERENEPVNEDTGSKRRLRSRL
jgi:hypothetical protein